MSIFKQVSAFHTEVLKTPPPNSAVRTLTEKWSKKTVICLTEELDELKEACVLNDRAAAADALIDSIYFAAGALVQLGVNPDHAFNIVHEANMKKVGRVKPSRGLDDDAIKPDEWISPDLAVLFDPDGS